MATATPNVSELAALLAGINAAKQAAPKAVVPADTPAPSIAAALPKQPLSVAAMPSGDPEPRFVPTPPPTRNVATEMTPQVDTLSPQGQGYMNGLANNQRGVREADVAKYKAPLNPDDYSPKWYERLFAGMATAGAAYQHNPNASEIGNNILHNRFNQAEYQRQTGLKGATEGLEAFDKGERLRQEQNQQNLTLQQFALNRTKMGNTYDSDVMQEQGPDGKVHYYKVNQMGGRMEVPEPSSVVQDRWHNSEVQRQQAQDAERERHNQEAEKNNNRRTDAMFAAINKRDAKPSEYEDWKAAFKRDNRRDPTAEEIVNRKPRGNGASASGTFKDSNSVTKWDQQWYANMRDKVRKDKMAAKNTNADADAAQAEYNLIEKQYNEEAAKHEAQKAEIYSHIKAGRTASVNDAGEVSAAGAKPQTQNQTPAKVASKAEVQAFAQRKGMKVAEVEKQLKAQGYAIR